jgi:hypothetical protein
MSDQSSAAGPSQGHGFRQRRPVARFCEISSVSNFTEFNSKLLNGASLTAQMTKPKM